MSFLFKKQKKQLTRLFFATDLHGSERTYRKFINAGKFYQANVLVMGGDITGKLLIPIIKESNGNYRATLQGTVQHLATDAERQTLLDKVGLLGFYSEIMEEDQFRSLQGDPHAVEMLFHQKARQRLESWVDLAETRLNGTVIKCFVTGGNDDDPEVLEPIHREGTQSFFACENKVVNVDDDHTMISVGLSTPTPWNTPREVSEEQLANMIEQMVSQVADMGSCIFNFHDPPIDSTLDTCPKLDWSTDPPTPIVQAGQIIMHGAGSKSVRKAIETNQPMLGLHGHIHESMAVAKIGRTTIVNPGSEYGEGVVRGCLINFSGGVIDSYQMTKG